MTDWPRYVLYDTETGNLFAAYDDLELAIAYAKESGPEVVVWDSRDNDREVYRDTTEQ